MQIIVQCQFYLYCLNIRISSSHWDFVFKKQFSFFFLKPTSSSSRPSSSSSSPSSLTPIQSTKTRTKAKPNIPQISSNISLSSRYSYDNVNENEEYIFDIHGHRRRPLPATPSDHFYSNNGQTKRMNTTNIDIQGDTESITSAMTLRTESYRNAHPFQSYTFDYPKRSSQLESRKDNQNQIQTKHYEISV